ncbi:MAG: hypothetical protein NTY19_08115 [Planctomycetota bacterium]|nr:hypothetical protein [Planctomycetota bacterium]
MSAEAIARRRELYERRHAANELRAVYQQGLEIAKHCPRYANQRHDKQTLKREADARNLNADTLQKLRQLVDPERGGFTPKELSALCTLSVRHRNVLGRSTLFQFMRVEDREQRMKFAEEAIVNGWKRERVMAEITKRFGSRRLGGRKRKLPVGVSDAMVTLNGMCNDWARWCSQMADTESEQSHIALDDLPADVRRQLQITQNNIEKLQAALSAELAKSNAGPAKRPARSGKHRESRTGRR